LFSKENFTIYYFFLFFYFDPLKKLFKVCGSEVRKQLTLSMLDLALQLHGTPNIYTTRVDLSFKIRCTSSNEKNHLILEFFNFLFWQKQFRQFKKKKKEKKGGDAHASVSFVV
jgi:hypothetical protein